jgi:PAS domain S-box-containing protein
MTDSRKNEARLVQELKDLQARVAELEADYQELGSLQNSLRESESKFRLLAENVPGIIYMCRNDERHTILYLNDTSEELTGYPKGDFLENRRSLVELFHPDDTQAVIEDVNLAVAEKRPFHLVYRIKHRSGQWRWVEEFGTGVFDEDNQELLFLEGFLHDVTERKRAEQEQLSRLDRVQRQQAALVKLATHETVVGGDFDRATGTITEVAAEIMKTERVGVWLLDNDRRQLRCVDLFQRTGGTHTNGTILDMSDYPRYFSAVAADRSIDASDARGDPRTSEFADLYLEPHGIASMLDAPIRLGGQVIGIVCHEHVGSPRVWQTDEIAFAGEVADQVAQAIMSSDRRRAEEELARHRDRLEELVRERTAELEKSHQRLRRSERLASVGTLAAGIAQEIDNPLSAILMDAQLALRFLDQPSVCQQSLKHIGDQAKCCIRVVRELLQFAADRPAEKWSTNLNDVVLRSQEDTQADAEQHGVHITLELADSPPPVALNPAGIELVFVNLIQNAVQSCEDGGHVTIRTQATDDRIRAVVCDDGCGMSDGVKQHAFDPFYTTRQNAGGTGLGLSMAQRIVAEHGGTISIQSQPGEGTTIILDFPLTAAPTCAARAAR